MSELNVFCFSKMMVQIKKAGQKFQIVLTFFNKLKDWGDGMGLRGLGILNWAGGGLLYLIILIVNED